MPDLVFELGVEELPPAEVGSLESALEDAATGLLAELSAPPTATLQVRATPRRLALLVRGLPARTPDRTEERRGPSVTAAFDKSGQPTRAAQGFAASVGLGVEGLDRIETPKGAYLAAAVKIPGRPVTELLTERLPALILDLPQRKKMRWSDRPEAFARPIQWIVALFDGAVLPLEIAGVAAGRASRGHRVHHPAAVPVKNADTYDEVLAAARVLVSRPARRDRLEAEARRLADEAGLEMAAAPEIVTEAADLTEWPIPVLCRYPEAYLRVPREVLEQVLTRHQRMLPLRDRDGAPAPRFIAVSNTEVPDWDVVREGYQRVVNARLADAAFFWDADLVHPLAVHAAKLTGMGFAKGLGTLADKVARVGVASARIADLLELSRADRATLEAAAPLFRSDQGTQMIYEFPDLAGVMARYYALEQGLPRAVADALGDSVKPVSADGETPSAVPGAVLALADRLDTVMAYLHIGQAPTGSADPFGVRRAAIGAARILVGLGLEIGLNHLLAATAEAFADSGVKIGPKVAPASRDFIWSRAEGLLEAEGLHPLEVRAALTGASGILEAARRGHLLRLLRDLPDRDQLLILYRRAANLAAEAPPGAAPDEQRLDKTYERPLRQAAAEASQAVGRLAAAVARRLPRWDLGRGAPELPANDVAPHLAKVIALKPPLDAFLDKVLVNDPDEKVRRHRLGLLAEVVAALRPLGALEHLAPR
jgi:glycyl-tRNA synthetase beta chain